MRFCTSASTAARSVVRMPSIVLRPTTSRMMLSATALTVSRAGQNVEHVVLGLRRIDLPVHPEMDVDDVLVAGEHLALLRHVGVRAGLR